MEVPNREILRSMIERKAEAILNSVDDFILPLFEGNPAIGRIAQTFITAKKREFVPKVQEYCDLLVETSCLNSEISLEEAITNAEVTLNEFISGLIAEKLGVPLGTVSISLQVLFGDGVFKL